MPYIVTCAYAGCATRFKTTHNKQRFCSRTCGNLGRPKPGSWGAASLRFHMRRAGSRKRFASLAGLPMYVLYRELPADETDAYHRGQLTNIGGILVKKCSSCQVARQLDSFHVDNTNTSGCRTMCAICREKEDDSEYFKT